MIIDLDNTLEQLDKQVWDEPVYDSYLIKTCYQLRKKPLRDFTIEDLRIMIGQNINLNFLIPLAIEKLKENILAEGDFYEGDLLKNVLTSEREYWLSNKNDWQIVCELFQQNFKILKQFETTKEIRNDWFDNFDKFKEIVITE